jgi:hypothetical protein
MEQAHPREPEALGMAAAPVTPAHPGQAQALKPVAKKAHASKMTKQVGQTVKSLAPLARGEGSTPSPATKERDEQS